MKRLSHAELALKMTAANVLAPATRVIRHVKTGDEYMIRGHAVRESDLALLVNYSPMNAPAVAFCRSIDELQSKFVLADGEEWPTLSDVAKVVFGDHDA